MFDVIVLIILFVLIFIYRKQIGVFCVKVKNAIKHFIYFCKNPQQAIIDCITWYMKKNFQFQDFEQFAYTDWSDEFNRYQNMSQNFSRPVNFVYFDDCTTYEELKKKYKELCIKLHPDNGGDIDEFQAMQSEYELLKTRFTGDV